MVWRGQSRWYIAASMHGVRRLQPQMNGDDELSCRWIMDGTGKVAIQATPSGQVLIAPRTDARRMRIYSSRDTRGFGTPLRARAGLLIG